MGVCCVKESGVNYKIAIRRMMKLEGMSYRGLARILGKTGAAYKNAINPVRRHSDGSLMPNGMTMETFFRIIGALNGRVILEWRNSRDCRDKFRWVIDNRFVDAETERREVYSSDLWFDRYRKYRVDYINSLTDDGDKDEEDEPEELENGEAEIDG